MAPSHPRVPHARTLLHVERRANDGAMGLLARIFGSPWTVYACLVVPLLVEWIFTRIQGPVFFLSSGWIQLFALPLFVYQANKRDNADDARFTAKATADHEALTHVAVRVDAVHDINTTQNARLARIETHLGIPPRR